MKKPPSLRESMPITTAFIDECRAAFGINSVNRAIRLGIKGTQDFYANENGIEVGTKIQESKRFVCGKNLTIRENALPAMPHHMKGKK